MNFLDEMFSNKEVRTENGMIGYASAGSPLVDINFMVSSFRNSPEDKICKEFQKALDYNHNLAIKWLFFLRDVRGGLGERQTFRVLLKYLAQKEPDLVKELMHLIPVFGRWDDLFVLIDTWQLRTACLNFLYKSLGEDCRNIKEGKNISLLTKWLPSCNASSAESKRLANIIRKHFCLTERNYRKVLSELRKYLNVTEVLMSNNKWHCIDYSEVPSKANIKYNAAFFRHDSSRRQSYIDSVHEGKEKMNTSVLYPHDIVCLSHSGQSNAISAAQAAWDKYSENNNWSLPSTIVVADGSGSMLTSIGKTNVTALDVANALAIFCSEHLSGPFKNNYITFSEAPQLVQFYPNMTLYQKIQEAYKYCEVSNTNIKKVFELILRTAVMNNCSPSDLPQNILIISDMEFDYCVTGSLKNVFDDFNERFKEKGYALPRIIFWNVNSRTNVIPMKENEKGILLVSGFSPNIFDMIASNKTNPEEVLIEKLNSDRYKLLDPYIS